MADDFDSELATIPRAAAPSGKNDFDSELASISRGSSSSSPPPAPITGDTPWSDVLSRGEGNVGTSALNTLKSIPEGVANIAHAVANPQQTYENLQNTDWGQVGSQLKHDYLTEEGWKQGIANDPVGRLMDVSMLAAGPEELAARGAMKAGLPGLAKGIGYVKNATDPATWITAGAKKVADTGIRGLNSVVGSAAGTGTGGTSLNTIYDAALKSKELAGEASAGLASQGNPVAGFEQAVRDYGTQRRIDYLSGMIDVKNDKQILDMIPVRDALDEVDQRFGKGSWVTPFKPSQVSIDTQNTRDALTKAINQHDMAAMTGTPTVRAQLYHPIGFDDLKHNIDAILDGTTPGTESHAAATVVRNAISKEIKDNSPVYAETMEDYTKASNALKGYRKDLSLGTGNEDAARRKLLSAFRNNVLSNFGERWNKVQQLAQNPAGQKALANLAGQANSAWTPRGLIGQFKTAASAAAAGVGATNAWYGPTMVGAATGHLLNPYTLIPAVMAQSPKLMGHANLLAGRIGRTLSHVPWRPFVYAGHAAGSPYQP